MSEVYGSKIEAQRRLTYLDVGQFTVNGTATPSARMGCPVGVRAVRIIGIHVLGDAVPADANGTMLLNVLVNDVSEAADDTLVSSEDLEVLVTAANQFFEATLAADGTEKIRTLEAGDSLRVTLVNDSAEVETNPNVVVGVEWHPVPDYDDLQRVDHPSEYIV